MRNTKEVTAFYTDKYQKDTEEKNKVVKLIFRRQFKYVAKKIKIKPKSVLDVGGGKGEYSLILQNMGYDVTMIDIAKSGVEIAKKSGVKKSFTEDLFKYKPKEKFDVVIVRGFSLLNTPNMSDFKTVIEKVKEVKSKEGVIFFNMISNLSGEMSSKGWYHHKVEPLKPIFGKVYVHPYRGLFSFLGPTVNHNLHKVFSFLKIKNTTHIIAVLN